MRSAAGRRVEVGNNALSSPRGAKPRRRGTLGEKACRGQSDCPHPSP